MRDTKVVFIIKNKTESDEVKMRCIISIKSVQ